MKKWFVIWFTFSCAILFAQTDSLQIEKERNLKVNGYVKNLNGMIFLPKDESVEWGFLHNRINAKWIPKPWFTGVLEVRNRIIYGEAVKSGMYSTAFLDKDNGIADITFLPFDTRSAKMVSSVERFWAGFSNENLELTVGRQRINWGVNLIWNPNDIFNTYSFMDFDYEERPGSDALRLKFNIGDMSSLEFAAKPGKYKEDDVYAMIYKFNRYAYDFQFLGGWYEKDLCVGAGWAGSIGDVGFKGEGTYFHTAKNFADTSGLINATIEFDHTFYGKIYANISYIYSSKGASSPDPAINSLFLSNGNVTAKMLSPSKHSAFVQLKSISSPVLSAGISGIYFFELNGLYVFPSVTYSINDNWEASFFLQSFWLKEKLMESKMNNVLIRLKYSF